MYDKTTCTFSDSCPHCQINYYCCLFARMPLLCEHVHSFSQNVIHVLTAESSLHVNKIWSVSAREMFRNPEIPILTSCTTLAFTKVENAFINSLIGHIDITRPLIGNSDTSAPLPPRPLVTSAPSHIGPTTTSAPVWKKNLVRSAPSHLRPIFIVTSAPSYSIILMKRKKEYTAS